ncbi:MAG: hypothetical protein DHS20C15_10230 [Planctomycetota bacterium]|nr:MAG: hypothetical protein DHS20C15_10230 [Planctomycetota bacterium]
MVRRSQAFLATLALPALFAWNLTACSAPPTAEEIEIAEAAARAEAERNAPPPFPAYAAHSRDRKVLLRERLQEIVSATRPLVLDVQGRLARKVMSLDPPLRFATKEPRLREWGRERQAEFQERVQDAYATTHEMLANLYESAVDRGISAAQDLTPPRSPLDEGATGNVLLDASVGAYEETLDSMFDFAGMELRQQQDVLRRVELLEVFSTFSVDGADELLGGRLLLFVGGEQRNAAPGARLVLRCEEGVDPGDRKLYQVARHRVMRGSTTVHDSGWRGHGGDDGMTTRYVEDAYLIASDVAPTLNVEEAGFEQLHDMRVIVDLQTGVLDAQNDLLGGVDWRIEFRVTVRGDVSWSMAASPAFDPTCPELVSVLSASGR